MSFTLTVPPTRPDEFDTAVDAAYIPSQKGREDATPLPDDPGERRRIGTAVEMLKAMGRSGLFGTDAVVGALEVRGNAVHVTVVLDEPMPATGKGR